MHQKFGLISKICCLILAFVLGVISLKLWDMHKNKAPREPQKSEIAAYQAISLQPQDVTLTTPYIGYITPIHEALIQPYISGFIEKIYVKGGDFVQKGDVLLVLKQDEYIAALNAAYADILKADAVLTNASNYYNRLKKAGKSVSAAELESAEASYLSALATLEQAKANYNAAKVNYDYTIITAPINGVVGNVSLTKGNYISPAGPALFSIMQYSPIRVVFSISDKEYLAELQKEKPFSDETLFLELPNGKIFKNTGVVRYTDNSIDTSTSSLKVYADFKNIGKILTPNTYVTVLSQSVIKNAVEVKKNLVLLQNDGNFIYLIRAGRLIKEKVEILATVDQNFILKNTFQKDDAVVLSPVEPQNIGQPAEIIMPKGKA